MSAASKAALTASSSPEVAAVATAAAPPRFSSLDDSRAMTDSTAKLRMTEICFLLALRRFLLAGEKQIRAKIRFILALRP